MLPKRQVSTSVSAEYASLCTDPTSRLGLENGTLLRSRSIASSVSSVSPDSSASSVSSDNSA